MKQDIELYINNQLVELGEDFEVNMTYTVENTTNPTAIKNNYSKTITIPATAHNNKIFSNIWNTTSIYYDGGYNLIKKSSFAIFLNGTKFEEGYIKLDNVIKNGVNIQYKCTLYGGLGDFFYNLSSNKDGKKIRLSDLDYGVDFKLTVNRELILEAWDALMTNQTEGTIFEHINFALCYNGIPEDFSANKVLIATFGSGAYELPYNISDGEYSSLNGWVLADLRQEYDEWAARDLRSYLQRPVFRLKTLINAICNPVNNGGYTVNLDEDFFNRANPYWEKAWITLPLIKDMEDISTIGSIVDVPATSANLNRTVQDYYKISVTVEGDSDSITIPFNLGTKATLTSNKELYTGYGPLLEDGDSNKSIYYNAPIAIQLVGYEKNTTTVAYYSDVEVFTSFGLYEYANTNYTKLNVGGVENVHSGSFIQSGSTTDYFWENGESFILSINNIDSISDYDWYIQISRYVYQSPYYASTYSNNYFDCLWLGMGSTENGNLGNNSNYISQYAYSTSIDISGNDTNASINKRVITKERMLGRDKTPLDYLLGYTKQMGLYFIKHPQEKVIDILTRKTFYKNNGENYDDNGYRKLIDLTNLIDTSKDIIITPLPFNKNWYDLGLDIKENKYSKIYDSYTDIKFGTKRIDTGYEYVKEVDNLIKDNPYKAGMMVREKNAYMVNFRLPKNN